MRMQMLLALLMISLAWGAPSYYQTCTYNATNITAGQTNFPVPCLIDTATLIAAGKIQGDCDDIRPAIGGITTQLLYEIENATCNTSSTVVWVGVNTTSGTTGSFNLTYGDPSAADGQNAAELWSLACYVSVYHMTQNYTLVDSTGRNNLSLVGNANLMTGLFGNGINFTRQGYYSLVGATGLPVGNNDSTEELWIRRYGAISGFQAMYGYGSGTTNAHRAGLIEADSTVIYAVYANDFDSAKTTTAGVNTFIAMRHNSTSTHIFVNDTNASAAKVYNTSATPTLRVGLNAWDTTSYEYKGMMDELRIRNCTSSYDWRRAVKELVAIAENEQQIASINLVSSSPANTTYPHSVPFTYNCSGAFTSYLLNISIDGAINVSNQAVTNASLFSTNITHIAGFHNASAVCWNGSISNTSATVFYTVQDAPVVTLYTPLNNTANLSSTIPFGFMATSAEATLSCSIYLDGDLNQTDASYSEGTIAQFVINNIENGNHDWQVRCSDSIGSVANSVTPSFEVYDSSGGVCPGGNSTATNWWVRPGSRWLPALSHFFSHGR